MKRQLLHTLNLLWLVAVLGALPWVASRSFWGWQIAARSTWQMLTLGACCVGIVLNGLGWWLARRRPVRRVCLGWAFGFVLVGVFEELLFRGIVHFRWLS